MQVVGRLINTYDDQLLTRKKRFTRENVKNNYIRHHVVRPTATGTVSIRGEETITIYLGGHFKPAVDHELVLLHYLP